MRSLEWQIKQIDNAIAEQLALTPNTLTSINGIDPVYSAGIIAEIGDINRFDCHHSLPNMQILPGLNTNQVIMMLKTPGLSAPAIAF